LIGVGVEATTGLGAAYLPVGSQPSGRTQTVRCPLRSVKAPAAYKACPALVDLTSGIVSPEFKAWYVNPTTNQQQAYTTCQADLAAAVAIQKDYAACPAIVGATTAQRQYQAWYADTTGARVNYGSCAPDLNSSMVIQTTSAGCSDFVDQSQMKAFTQVRSFYYDAAGTAVPVKDCAPDPAQTYPLVNDYAACRPVVNEAAGYAEDVGQLYYMNGSNTRVTFGTCTPDPNRLYVIKQDFSSCPDQVDIPKPCRNSRVRLAHDRQHDAPPPHLRPAILAFEPHRDAAIHLGAIRGRPARPGARHSLAQIRPANRHGAKQPAHAGAGALRLLRQGAGAAGPVEEARTAVAHCVTASAAIGADTLQAPAMFKRMVPRDGFGYATAI
jgi:hypothetical protein